MATRWFILLSAFLWGADQISKAMARKLVSPEDLKLLIEGEIGAVRNEIIPGFFSLTLNFNKGIAWGMLPEWSEYFTYFAIIMVLVIFMILGKLEKDEVWLKIALALQMSGALGNMTDRLIMHRVTDFLDVKLFLPGTSWTYDWPIFNLADSFVVIGTIVLVSVLIFTREQHPDKKHAPVPEVIIRSKNLQTPASGEPEEALIELPIVEEGYLEPYEEVKGGREILSDAIGGRDTDADEKINLHGDNSEMGDPDKLDELSKRPEKS